jgi:intracellular sulfur oxidation DsrE/DsrF family protein
MSPLIRLRKRHLLAGVLMLAALALWRPGSGQESPRHRIVFEVTGDGTQLWEAVLNNVENARQALGTDATEITVVAHGRGIGLVTQDNAGLASRLARIASPSVHFVACENTMARLKLTRDALLPAVGTVDSGVAEVVRLQEAGWSYIKSGF